MVNSYFNKNHFNTLLDKFSKENKQVFLLGDFNLNLQNYNCHKLIFRFCYFKFHCIVYFRAS